MGDMLNKKFGGGGGPTKKKDLLKSNFPLGNS